MEKANQQMKKMLLGITEDEIPEILKPEFQKIVNGGILEENGCYFLKVLYEKKGNATINEFPDKTGYECFVNHIHIDDLVENPKLEDAIAFSKILITSIKKYLNNSAQTISVIISWDEMSQTIRFHLKRNGENWLTDDLEEYTEEAILLIEE